MNTQLKHNIITAAQAYLVAHGISQNELAKNAGINQGYISTMLKGNFENVVNGATVPIGVKWFAALATYIGYSFTKSYWATQAVPQFTQMIDVLEGSKSSLRTAMIIGPTGCGKTYTVDVFVKKNPNYTYRLTVSSLYKLRDIIDELGNMLGIEHNYSMKKRVDSICQKLIDVRRNGGNPIIIIDEGENMKLPVLHMVKALYDVLKNYCSIVIVGTPELLTKLEKLKAKNREGIPQLYRRFKAGLRHISSVSNNDFKVFLNHLAADAGLQKLLLQLCDNYGELNDYLEPALKAADEQGVELTEDFFRLMYNMPKYSLPNPSKGGA